MKPQATGPTARAAALAALAWMSFAGTPAGGAPAAQPATTAPTTAPMTAPTPAAAAAPGDSPDRISERVESAVVKIFSTTRNPDVNRPWARQAPADVTGSGVVIDGHRILTNAHVIAYAGQVQVQANREGDKYAAHVAAVAPGIDLAVLTLDDETFFQHHAPLERSGALPQIKDAVLAYGFPLGGTSLSITKGIVSRIEFADYHVNAAGLRVQIDAAINPGNSGGPATVGDRMIGLAFSTLLGAQNIGYIIPNEEIEIFLRDIADGHYDGKPNLHDELQTLESPALRSYLKLDRSVHGAVVHRPFRSDPAYPLHEWDVVKAVAGVPVDDEGMVLVDGNLRLDLRYQVQHAARDGAVTLTIARGGKTLDVKVPVQAERPSLLKPLDGAYPSYFIYGPVVFTRATTDLVGGLRAGHLGGGLSVMLMSSPLLTQLFDVPSAEREELVVIPAPLFPHPTSKGYGGVVGSVVDTVNGVKVKSLKHLVQLLRDLRDEFVVIRMDSKRDGEGLVLRRAEIAAATEEILSDNGVRAQGSPDMMAVWQAQGKAR
jgi:S1-C subfamily serine protease